MRLPLRALDARLVRRPRAPGHHQRLVSGLRYRRIHTLRHIYASLLLERRASLAYVSEQLGHASSSVTLRVYTHLIPRSGAGPWTPWTRTSKR